jgi:hypothetical protein
MRTRRIKKLRYGGQTRGLRRRKAREFQNYWNAFAERARAATENTVDTSWASLLESGGTPFPEGMGETVTTLKFDRPTPDPAQP